MEIAGFLSEPCIIVESWITEKKYRKISLKDCINRVFLRIFWDHMSFGRYDPRTNASRKISTGMVDMVTQCHDITNLGWWAADKLDLPERTHESALKNQAAPSANPPVKANCKGTVHSYTCICFTYPCNGQDELWGLSCSIFFLFTFPL